MIQPKMANKPLILIIEDDPNRMYAFYKVLDKTKYEIVHAEWAEDAIRFFEQGLQPNIIFFDHDLGGQQFVESTDINTGYQVAKYLVKHKYYCEQAIIHSCNPAGAENIRALIEGQVAKKTFVIPFPILIKELQDYNL
jgi:CheY-like chemotaxis protein